MARKQYSSFKFRHMEKLVGFFVLIGFLIILITVILMGREQKWFNKTVEFSTIFDSAKSLESGMDVKIKGLTVGKVDNIHFSKDNKVEASFSVYEEFLDKIKADTYVFKESSSPLGGGFLSLTIGSAGSKKVNPGEYLISQDSKIVQYLLANDMIPEKSSSIDKIIKNVRSLTAQLSSPQGPLIGTLDNLNQISARLSSPGGSLNTLLDDNNQLYTEIHESLRTVKEITHDLQILSATLRDTAPDIRNVVQETETGVQEITKVMVGLQEYFSMQEQQKTDTGSEKEARQQPVGIDRRQDSY